MKYPQEKIATRRNTHKKISRTREIPPRKNFETMKDSQEKISN